MDNPRSVLRGSEIVYDRLDSLAAENRRLKSELSRSEESRAELYRLLNQDPHTGLPIRRVFDRDLAAAMDRDPDSLGMAVLRLDKAYDRIRNSRDRSRVLLFKTALRIQSVIGEHIYQSDRLDEFFLIIPDVQSDEDLAVRARNVVRAVSAPHEPPAADIAFACHIGLARSHGGASGSGAAAGSEGVAALGSTTAGGSSVHDLVGNAYIALNAAESRGLDHLVYTADLGEAFRRGELIEKELRRAIQNGFDEFSMKYQPFVNAEGRITGAEALIRWRSPTVGAVGPDRFIPLAEETGDIRLIGQWTLYNACRQLVTWWSFVQHPMHISVNLSSSQFKEHDLVERIEGVLKALRLDGDAVKLELTETAVMQDPVQAILVMDRLRRQGIRISIDDFGTGYSSLSYLKQFPVQTVKIDKSFVEGIGISENSREIVKAIISMAKNLHMETLAEGVETEEQFEFLLAEGCDHVQGYYFSPPVDGSTFASYLAEGARLHGGRESGTVTPVASALDSGIEEPAPVEPLMEPISRPDS